ncbi:phosphatase PAP2 family protein [Pulveribacter sp.]|uniref:phosphatase PAP2 family protein n=1 Tax=Pulveribacter sp. TaxID=2678893 RepID=UPI0028AA75CB|nr:phosphatase PAP2 family protein [Pulveribacter sp.]
MFAFDLPVFQLFNATAATPATVVELARFSSYVLPWLALAVLAAATLRGPWPARRAVLLCLLALALAWSLAQAVRWAMPVQRPFALGIGMQWVEHRANAGFPSMHASIAFALAMSASLYAPRPLAVLAWASALLVAWSRLCLGVHFPSDVLAGALLGPACAWAVARVARRLGGGAGLTARGRS